MLSNLSSLLTNPAMLEKLEQHLPRETLKDGENRFVSVLFADVKGYSELSEILPSEHVHSLLDQLMLSFSERIHKYGGYVDKYEGDRIMAHFGSLSFLEQNSRRAVYAGLELIEVIRLFNQIKGSIPELAGLDHNLALRVGINTGMVTTGRMGLKREGDFTIVSDVVNLASRMEEYSKPMRLMVPEAVKEELEGYFEFEYNAHIRVKGFANPVNTWFVLGVNTAQIARRLSQSRFIGRDKELQALHQSLGSPEAVKVFALVASAGMGKSRLIREFASGLPEFSCLVSEISPLCQTPFCSITSLLEQGLGLTDAHDESDLGTRINKCWDQLKVFLPERFWRDDLPKRLLYLCGRACPGCFEAESRDDLVANLNCCLLLFLQAYTLWMKQQGHCLVLVFDDLHFADVRSLQSITFLLKNIRHIGLEEESRDIRLRFVLAWRDSFRPGKLVPPQVRVQTFSLAELNAEQIDVFLDESFGDIRIPRKIKDAVSAKSAGNPLFLEEWISLIRKHLGMNTDIDLESLPIPNSISSLVLARLDSLDKPAIRLLQDSSAIGISFPKSILNQLELELGKTADPGSALQRVMDIRYLECTGLRLADPEYSFRHQIIHQTVYSTILRENRRILHRIIGEIIEREKADQLSNWCFALAEHFYNAGIADKATGYLRESEIQASRLFMNGLALLCCQRLLGLCAPDEELKYRIRIASLHLDMGNYLKAVSVLREIDQDTISQRDVREAAILAKARLLFHTEGAVATVDYLQQHLPALSGNHQARIMLADARRLTGADDNWLKTTLALLDELSYSPEAAARLENIIALYLAGRGDHQRALHYFNLCLEHSLNYRNIQLWAMQNKANLLSKLGDMEQALELYQRALQIARLIDDDAAEAKLNNDLGGIYLLYKDEPETALRLFEESHNAALQTGNKQLQALSAYNIAACHFALDNAEAATPPLQFSIKMSKRLKDQQGITHARDLQGDILYQQGRMEEAKKIYQSNLRLQTRINDPEGIAHSYGNLANIAADTRDWAKAEDYYARQQRILHECGDLEGEAKAWYNWAIIDEERNSFATAINKLEKAIKLFKQGGFSGYNSLVEDYMKRLMDNLSGKGQ